MEVTLLCTLEDGSTHNTAKGALSHLDNVVGNLVLRVGEVFANKSATEIAKLIAISEEVLPLMSKLVEAEEYLVMLESNIGRYKVAT